MCIYVCLKGFLADLSYGDLYLTNHPCLKATTKSPCQEICEIPSILCFWKEQLTVTNVLGLLFWSLFPLLWLDRADFALESRTAVVDLACSIDGIEALQGSGAGCSVHPADTQIKGFLPQTACCDGKVREVGWGFGRGRGGGVENRNPRLPHAHLWPEVHCSQRQPEAGSLDYIIKALLAEKAAK